MLKRLDKSNSCILAAAAAVRSPLVISLGFERNAETLYSARISGFVEFYAGNADLMQFTASCVGNVAGCGLCILRLRIVS